MGYIIVFCLYYIQNIDADWLWVNLYEVDILFQCSKGGAIAW